MPKAVNAFLKREILQKGWHKQLLEPSFKAACGERVILKCGDGITRRVFPKMLLYSADLQEKWVSMHSRLRRWCWSLVDPTWVDTPPAVLDAPAAWWKKKSSQTLARPMTRQNANVSSESTHRRCRRQLIIKARKRIFEQGRPIQSSKFIRSLLQPFGCSATLVSSFLVSLADTPIFTVTILICVWFFHLWRLPSDFCHWLDAWDGAWGHQEHRIVHVQDRIRHSDTVDMMDKGLLCMKLLNNTYQR